MQLHRLQVRFFEVCHQKLAEAVEFPNLPDATDAPAQPAMGYGLPVSAAAQASADGPLPDAPPSPTTAPVKASAPLATAVQRVRAKFKYTPQAGDELELNPGEGPCARLLVLSSRWGPIAGDVLVVTKREDDGWCHGRNVKGQAGVFPGNYVEECE